jgi:DegV family protein with EDD domain
MENTISKFKIVADSAADLFSLDEVNFAAAPLKIITDEKEYLDTESLDVKKMVDELAVYKGKSTTSCPNPDEWLEAFGDAQYIFSVTLSSGISGSYNAATVAKDIYESENPGRKVFIVDSLSAGPQETILVEKLQELILSGLEFDEICEEIKKYQKKTGIWFVLESFTNFANNGRVSHTVAKLAGLLGISIVCTASDKGTIITKEKCRGAKKSAETIISHIKNRGKIGKIRIAHCFNEAGAKNMKKLLTEIFPAADIKIHSTHGLCSFYAERGGLLVAFATV